MNNIRCEALGRYISQIHRQGSAFLSKKFSKFGIGYGQAMFLIKLYSNDGVIQEQLSEILCIDKGTTARAVKRLEENGFVRRVRDDKDKRAYRLYLTDKALDIENDIFDILTEREAILVNSLSDEEFEVALKLLKKMCD